MLTKIADRRVAALLGLMAGALLLAACDDSDVADTTTTTTTAPAAAPAPVVTPSTTPATTPSQ